MRTGQAVGAGLVHGAHHEAVAVGVGEVLVDPGLRLRLQLVLVELAAAQQHLAVLAVDRVAVDVDVL